MCLLKNNEYMTYPLIRKTDGSLEEFNPRKLRRSLKRVGVGRAVRDRVVQHIEAELSDGMSTNDIYKHAFELLRQFEHEHPVAAARYSIKRAILDLGPSGFPFEQFIAGVMRAHGAQDVQTGVLLQGKCVAHEVDVVGILENKRFGMELKFHNSLGTKTDLKVALYVKARWDDLAQGQGGNHVDQGWLVTNTRFTHNVIKYVQCSKAMKLLGWNYPYHRGLEVLIEEAHLHPITLLTTLNNREKRALLDANVVLCKDLHGRADILRDIGVKKRKIDAVLSQVAALGAL